MKNLLFILLAFIVGCASTPLELINEINNVPESKVYPNELSALSNNSSRQHITENRIDLEFNKSTPLLIVNKKRAPFNVVELSNNGELLEVSTVIKSAGWRKDAFVLPKITFSKSNLVIPGPKVKETKIDNFCGLDACLVTIYDLSTIQKGPYKLLFSAYVENMNSPLEFRKVDGFYYAGNIPLPISAERAQYATFYGTVKVKLIKY